MDSIVTYYLHFLGIGLLFAALAVELVLFKPTVSGAVARKLAKVDGLYGIAALLMIVTGLLQVFSFGKTPEYYGQTFMFHIKMTVFLIVLLVSIFPTIKFIKARNTPVDGEASYPKSVGLMLKIEMALLVIIPLLGVLMANGYGYRG
ncbi:MAG: putative membrane protein [Candidatus Krumholzibacteriia bacterium]|jgi:putative membrane protein